MVLNDPVKFIRNLMRSQYRFMSVRFKYIDGWVNNEYLTLKGGILSVRKSTGATDPSSRSETLKEIRNTSPLKEFIHTNRFEPMVFRGSFDLIEYIGQWITKYHGEPDDPKVYDPYYLYFDNGKLRRPVFSNDRLREKVTYRLMRSIEPTFGKNFTGRVVIVGMSGVLGCDRLDKKKRMRLEYSLSVEPKKPKIN